MTSKPIENVIVLGASGSVGPAIIEALISSGFKVSALTRQSSKATFPSTVNVIRSDYSPGSLVNTFKGQDAVVSTIATFSVPEQIAIIDAAITAGVRRFIPSEFGIDMSSAAIADVLPLAMTKHDIVAHLRTKETEDVFSWTAICVGGFFDWSFQYPGLMGWNLPERTATIFDGGDIPYEATNLRQIGRAVAAVLSADHLDETANRYVYINSFTLTQNQVLAALERATGDKFTVINVSREEVSRAGLEKMKTGIFESIGGGSYLVGSTEAIEPCIYDYGGFNHYSETRGLWNERLGLPKEDLDETIERVLAGRYNQ